MNYIEAAILGLVQGLCEFLPVSSSGHLVLFQTLFGMQNPDDNALLVVLLHLATLIAVVVAFRRRIGGMLAALFRLIGKIFTGKFSWKRADGNERMVVLVVISTLLLVPFVLIQKKIEALFASLLVVGIALLVTALMLILADRISRRRKHSAGKTAEQATVLDSVVVGLFQCAALVPGLSRSGSTITGGLVRGFDREFAVEYSFILSIPAVLGSVILKVKDAAALIQTTPAAQLGPILVAMLVAGLSGYLAIRLVRLVAKKDRFGAFAYYCAAAGVFAIVYSIIR